MDYKIRPIMKNRLFGAFMFLMGLIGFGIIVMRICCYKFEYVPGYYEVDYGRFNFFSFFTVQSNLYVSFYLVCLALAVFGSQRASKIAFNPIVRLTVTTYILVTGAVYCGGIPMGMTPPLSWDNFQHAMLGTVQVFHHMIMPPFMLVLFLIPPTNEKIVKKKIWLVGLYPLVYSVFSIVRGSLGNPTEYPYQFYPYPFYRPDFFWNMFFPSSQINLFWAYILMIPMLFLGIGVFILIALLLTLINNKLCKKLDK